MSNYTDYADAFDLVLEELKRAEKKHPVFPVGAAGVSVITEELGELAQAMNDNKLEHCVVEAAHVAVTSLRFMTAIMSEKKSAPLTTQKAK